MQKVRSRKFVEKCHSDPRAYEPGGFTAESPDPNMDFSHIWVRYVSLSKYLRFTAACGQG